jgi:hypothetical protein
VTTDPEELVSDPEMKAALDGAPFSTDSSRVAM